ncbi:MAG: lipoate--protein ligase, partial [Candidatus Cloacimonadota bacterium]
MDYPVKWRLLDTGIKSAAENIALDEAILEVHSKGLIPNTLRFLQYYPEAVLIGYHQSVENEVRIDYCREKGIEIGRRITGGGAIYFDSFQLG